MNQEGLSSATGRPIEPISAANRLIAPLQSDSALCAKCQLEADWPTIQPHQPAHDSYPPWHAHAMPASSAASVPSALFSHCPCPLSQPHSLHVYEEGQYYVWIWGML